VKILLFGDCGYLDITKIHNKFLKIYEYQETSFDIKLYAIVEDNMVKVLSDIKPDLIVSIGNKDGSSLYEKYSQMYELRLEDRYRWLNFEYGIDEQDLANSIVAGWIANLDRHSSNDSYTPLVSVITPLYHTHELLFERAYISLCKQTYTNWEWVLIDDSKYDTIASGLIYDIIKADNRIRYYKRGKNSGYIGETKNEGFKLADGKYLLELDHDDYLLNDCIENVVKAFQMSDDIGFVYGHTIEKNCIINNNYELQEVSDKLYGEGWGFGYGKYSSIHINGVDHQFNVAPNINPITIRHIIASPNHVRVWERDLYNKIGGHNKKLEIVDDYELMIRTFLNTRMCLVDKPTYVQTYMDDNNTNTQYIRNRRIQSYVEYIRHKYEKNIHERIHELGFIDPINEFNKYDLNQFHSTTDEIIMNYIYAGV
jgi:glycosyltransferase involved in cell wall biosynthesis